MIQRSKMNILKRQKKGRSLICGCKKKKIKINNTKSCRFIYANENRRNSKNNSPVFENFDRKSKDKMSEISSSSENSYGNNNTDSNFHRVSTPKSFQKLINENSSFNLEELIDLVSKLNKNLEKIQKSNFDQEFSEKIKNQWALLSKIIDRLLLYGFLLITTFILGNIYIYIQIVLYTNRNKNFFLNLLRRNNYPGINLHFFY
jgi:hypothetical protein